jgi:ATP/maltotriose-dependent transcriptional regulator MalT
MSRAGTVTIARLLGLLAQTIGHPDLAVSHFEDALAFSREAGYRPELAWTSYDYATFLRTRRRENRALALVREARSICEELGMRPLMERVNSLLENTESEPPKRTKCPADLTERQLQVLRLLAKGNTGREIAKELELSERTVERHIAGIYDKKVPATGLRLPPLPSANRSLSIRLCRR